ncbi:HlyD family secretion protein [Pararhodonellum marinum]|uniref:HlyD family secretion protein n=1 Tax=Pararhodonellum marinum TaxID=2755358 RepID=UPI001E52B509|nr:HlyD family efflux transporter periplasmic adaptor subunit [Pararhodonellum marinum]
MVSIFLGFLVALPLVHVDVAVQSRGTFQSALHRNQLTSSVGGRLELWNMVENQKVRKGELIAVVRGEVLSLEMEGVNERLNVLNDFIGDLGRLVKLDFHGHQVELIKLRSKFYQASLLEFQSRVLNQTASVQKLERDFKRAEILYSSNTIPFAEYDNVEVQYKQAVSQLDMIKKQKLNEWEHELINYQNEKIKLSNQLEVLTEQIDQYKIIAGTDGTLMNVMNLNVGDFVHANQKLAEISPDTTMLAVTYLSPADIAFISKGQKVTFQVDAFNYNQWGIAEGKVVDVADDLTLISEKEAGFLVTCSLNSPVLTLSSGQKGTIKKGMTFNGRFIVAKRSLFQLLYDKVDNWINPSNQPI